MSILWCGGEDLDFPNGAAVAVNTTAGNFRSGWARCCITASAVNTFARSLAFQGGAVTSCWLSCRMAGGSAVTNQKFVGLIKDATSNAGLWLMNSSPAQKLALIKTDGTTVTTLASESGSSLSLALHRIDMQVINYGASATVNIYIDGAFLFSFSGDVTVTGVTSLSAVGIGAQSGNDQVSEIIVSDTDTRSLQGLVTLALTGAGTTNAWTNTTFSNINGTTLSDVNPTNSNTAAQDDEYNVTDLPSGTFSVLAVKQSIRAAVSSTPTATQIKMGYNSGGTLGFGTGATKTPATAYGTIEQFDATNPVTAAAWAQADMNALQLEYQSA